MVSSTAKFEGGPLDWGLKLKLALPLLTDDLDISKISLSLTALFLSLTVLRLSIICRKTPEL